MATRLGLRRGDLVEVRGPSEILATLDPEGALDRMPFMPEMAAYCGRRLVVERRAEKICDTIHYTGSRRLDDAVLLQDLRCDGSGHGGCQAECRFFWKEAWLKKVDDASLPTPAADAAGLDALVGLTSRQTRYCVDGEGKAQERFRCQATELPKATRHLKVWDLRTYVREYTCGNVGFGHFLRVTARAAVYEVLRKLGLVPEVHLPGTARGPVVTPPLDLQPGELVRISTKEEIARTLDKNGRNRGLWFDREMIPFCGGTYRVRQRVKLFIDDRTGKMIELKGACVTLEGVVCSGDLSLRRWFCPRAIFSFWRESWLHRVEGEAAATGAEPPPGDRRG